MFHQQTKVMIDKLTASTPQSLLLTGKQGVGLYEIARTIAQSGVIRHEVTPDETKATPIISVEMIRDIYINSRAKSTHKQFIIVRDADTMSLAAQASFLKLLEEPQQSIHFILTSNQPDRLLPTITSRVQRHVVQPLTSVQSNKLLDELGVADQTKRQQLLFIASGLTDELTRLAQDEQHFAFHAKLMVDARDLLQAKPYQKLLLAHAYKDDRQAAILLIKTAIKLLRTSLSIKPQPVLVEKIELLASVLNRLEANGNIRLQILRFVV